MFTKFRLAETTAEFLGAATLVLVAITLTQTTSVSYFIATSLAVALAAVVAVFGGISGAHVNPAITLGMWTARRIGTLKAITFVAAQMLGALAAWQLYQYLTGQPLAAKESSFTTPLWLGEVVGTSILALGVVAAVSRGLDTLTSAVASGAAFFVGIMVASSAAASYLNPAIALGVRDWSAAHVLGPLVGGLVAVNLYYLLFAPSPTRSTATKSRKR